MKTIVPFLLMTVLLCSSSPAQSNNTSSNSIYLELLGNGLIYSLNYDRMLAESFGARVGIGYYRANASTGPDKVSLTTVPIMVHYLIGSGNSKLEIGGGVVLVFLSARISKTAGFEGSGTAGTATFGYRYQPTRDGLNARLGFTPFFGDFGFQPWFGVSFGYGF